MDAILVDVFKQNEKVKIMDKFKYFFLRKIEYEYSSKLKFANVNINEKYLRDILKYRDNKTNAGHLRMIYIKLLEKLFKYFFSKTLKGKNQKNNLVIYSSNILKSAEYNEYISKLLDEYGIKQIETTNTMLENDLKNIKDYISKNNLEINRLKILYMLKNRENFDAERFLTYISSYKFVDILYMNKIDSNIRKIVNNLNNEYGTSIEVMDKKNISKYDIYVLVDFDKENLIRYILNKKRLVIGLNNPEDDLFNEYNKKYDKNMNKLSNINNIEKFSKTNIGYAIYASETYLTNSV